jgi:hypothetical protein
LQDIAELGDRAEQSGESTFSAVFYSALFREVAQFGEGLCLAHDGLIAAVSKRGDILTNAAIKQFAGGVRHSRRAAFSLVFQAFRTYCEKHLADLGALFTKRIDSFANLCATLASATPQPEDSDGAPQPPTTSEQTRLSPL